MYITIENLNDSIERCVELVGQVVDGPRSPGDNRFCMIRDPAAVVVVLCSSS